MKLICILSAVWLLIAGVNSKAAEEPPCPGCFIERATNDEDIQRAADFAVENIGTGYTLLEILEAKSAVVAGTKYQLVLKVEQDEKPYRCSAEVLQNLPGETPPEFELLGSSCENLKRNRMAFFYAAY